MPFGKSKTSDEFNRVLSQCQDAGKQKKGMACAIPFAGWLGESTQNMNFKLNSTTRRPVV